MADNEEEEQEEEQEEEEEEEEEERRPRFSGIGAASAPIPGQASKAILWMGLFLITMLIVANWSTIKETIF